MKEQKGNFTIQQLLDKFPEADPREIAKGFIMHTESQVGRSK